ncbi:MAG: Mur ligase family protein, partial [Bacteroidota bacterium]
MKCFTMMNYSFTELTTAMNGTVAQHFTPDSTIEHILFDSRKVIFPQTSVFFAIVGKRQNGHHFIVDAYTKGVRHFVVNATAAPTWTDLAEANVIRVTDTTTALQRLARFHRRRYHYPVIGITGSNGKTIVKEWLFQLLHTDYRVVRSPKSYNSQIGVPLSVMRMQSHHDLGIFEAGISKMHEMERIAPIVAPTIGIFTNIGAAHSEGFASQAE